MTLPLTASRAARLCLLTAATALAACSDNDNLPAEAHDHENVETSGRLVIGQSGAPTAHVYDLDTKAMLNSFTLDFAATAVYPSPDRRYAVIAQRNDNRTQFIDGGIWQEDHGDHLHDYKEEPLLLAFELDGVRPTHYEIHDELSALFFDGDAEAGQNAGVAVLSDASITNGEVEAALDLSVAMHGTAEPRGDFLLTTHREAEAAGTLPSAVDLYLRDGEGYDFVERFAEPCPELHGSFSNETHTAFGCGNGVLLVEQDGETFTASKVPNTESIPEGSRIGTIVGHHELRGFGGLAGSALYAIDPESGTMTEVDWNGETEVTRVAHAMDAHGENFLILDSAGRLHFLDPADSWSTAGSVDDVIETFVEGQAPVITMSDASGLAFVTDPADQSIAVIDLESQTVVDRIDLAFTPAGMTWLGLGEHEH